VFWDGAGETGVRFAAGYWLGIIFWSGLELVESAGMTHLPFDTDEAQTLAVRGTRHSEIYGMKFSSIKIRV